MSLTPLDGIVAVVILISAILAMVRGFVREILSVASWVVAAVAAYAFYDDLLVYVKPYIASETVATIVSAAVIFFVVLVIASYITMKIADFVIDSRAGALDRLLGFAFGAVRGLLLVIIAYRFFIWFVPTPPPWIANAQSAPMLQSMAEKLIAMLPEDIETQIQERLRGRPGGAGEEAPNEAPADTPDDNPAALPPSLVDPGAPDEGYDNNSRERLNQIFEGNGPGD